jgi:hypothetical protein
MGWIFIWVISLHSSWLETSPAFCCNGMVSESLQDSVQFLIVTNKISLAIHFPKCFASLEYWAFEILVFLAGLMPGSEISTSLIAIWYVQLLLFVFTISWNKISVLTLVSRSYSGCPFFFFWIFSVNTETVAYMLTYGLSAAARFADNVK